MASKNKQIIVVFGAVILTVLLIFVNKKGKPVKKEKPVESSAMALVDMKLFTDTIVASLPASQTALLTEMESNSDKAKGLDSIAQILLKQSPGASAYYLEQSADVTKTAGSYKKAGLMYYKATRFDRPYLSATLFNKAIMCYKQAIALDTNDLEASTMLGTCYVEGGLEPMEGIMLLRKVVEKDSTFIDAQVQLGMFAIQSGQSDKAIERFNKILRIKPDYIQSYIYLGQVYADMGKKDKAIEMLELYLKKSTDKNINKQVELFIQELKNT